MIARPITRPITRPVARAITDIGYSLERQIAALFSNGEQGAWYDIAPQYCFQDDGGTTPAAIGDPVGLVLDRSGRGNHASQTTATSRPILRQNATTGAHYLEFDGSDDWLVTSSINFTATDKMTVWAGVRKLSDAAAGLITEFSAGSGIGIFRLFAPGGGGAEAFSFGSQGTFGVYASTPVANFPAPVSCVVAGIAAIGSDTCLLRVNGAQRGLSGSDQGTGNYGNYPLYIGRRGGTSSPFNGHLYGFILRGAASNDSQIKIVERYLAQKTGVTLA